MHTLDTVGPAKAFRADSHHKTTRTETKEKEAIGRFNGLKGLKTEGMGIGTHGWMRGKDLSIQSRTRREREDNKVHPAPTRHDTTIRGWAKAIGSAIGAQGG